MASLDLLSPSRRDFLVAGGALIVSFSLFPRAGQGQSGKPAALPGDLSKEPLLDSWIRIAADGSVTVFTGKAELGQGLKTALLQIAAEQLSVDMNRITLITADTERTPDEGYTAGSHSMQDSGTAILHAAAQVRELLLDRAAKHFGMARERLSVQQGEVRSEDRRSVGYGTLVGDEVLHVQAKPVSSLKDPASYSIMGKPVSRVDIPAKVTGGIAYVQDLHMPGMVHARVVRPPSRDARLQSLGMGRAQRLPGVLKIVRDGNYLAVVAEHEYQAIQAMRALSDSAVWSQATDLPFQADIYAHLQALPSQEMVIAGDKADTVKPGAIQATYLRPYQIHGSIGPSCAVGLFQDGKLTLWTHSQGVYPLRGAVAEMVRMSPEQVHCIQVEGSGCYGHNGADDAAADAALIAIAMPGKPVRVQWTREQEHAWEPYGPAMASKVSADLDPSGKVSSWQYEVWSNAHSTRPGKAGNLAPAWLIAAPFELPAPRPIPQPEGGGDRNAVPLYRFPNARVAHHFIKAMPLRVSALRALGGYMNVFSIESFMDELAAKAKADPVEFRLQHLDDERAKEVIRAAANRFGWRNYKKTRNAGRGFGFARYKNLAGYLAVALELKVEPESGEIHLGRVVAAIDSGEVVNPDGIVNQVEGGIVQSLSWTMMEAVTWEGPRIASRDWSAYPILRMPQVPASIEVQVIDRPGQPFLGVGEVAQGPAAAALANALADAAAIRLREIPFTAKRVKAAIAKRQPAKGIREAY